MEKPITPDLTPTGRPRTKHKTVIDRRGELPGLQGDGPQTVSGFAIPNCPTTAQELIRTWGIAGMDVDSTSVKILRPITGKRAVELLAEMPISDYSMQKLAAMVGPGFYILRASAPYIKSNARTINMHPGQFSRYKITQKLARSNRAGFVPSAARIFDIGNG